MAESLASAPPHVKYVAFKGAGAKSAKRPANSMAGLWVNPT